MALTNDKIPYWFQGLPTRQAKCSQLKAQTDIYHGALGIQVNGVGQNAVSGAAMAALCQGFAGGDANSGVYVSARSAQVRVALVSAAAESIAIAYGATIDVTVNYLNGTSTPNSLCNLIRAHAEADRLLRVKPYGTGAGTALVAAALVVVPFISLLGAAVRAYLNGSGNAILVAAAPDMTFDVGTLALTSSDVPQAFGARAFLTDENTIQSTADPLAIQIPVYVIEGTRIYCDLTKAR